MTAEARPAGAVTAEARPAGAVTAEARPAGGAAPGAPPPGARPAPERSRRRTWVSQRAVLLHAALVICLPAFVVASDWQWHRALGGNVLSWAYCFEWPMFACLSVWGWWTLLHVPVDPVGVPGPAGVDVHWYLDEESPELRRYNQRLAALAAGAGDGRADALTAGDRRALPGARPVALRPAEAAAGPGGPAARGAPRRRYLLLRWRAGQ